MDSVYSSIMTMSKERQDSDDMLAEEELLHHFRKLTRELDFLLDLPFCTFWAYMKTFPIFINFLDEFLQNLRKYNDLEKIVIDLDQSFNDSKLSSSGPDTQKALKK